MGADGPVGEVKPLLDLPVGEAFRGKQGDFAGSTSDSGDQPGDA